MWVTKRQLKNDLHTLLCIIKKVDGQGHFYEKEEDIIVEEILNLEKSWCYCFSGCQMTLGLQYIFLIRGNRAPYDYLRPFRHVSSTRIVNPTRLERRIFLDAFLLTRVIIFGSVTFVGVFCAKTYYWQEVVAALLTPPSASETNLLLQKT